jgi:hypothetical protein
MHPFRSKAEARRAVALAGKERQPCMLCNAEQAPHCRDITLIREDGAQWILVARFCPTCHRRPDRAARTRATLHERTGQDIAPSSAAAPWRRD